MQINKIREDIAVTIVCITYAHEDFNRDALDSFLMQKTDFEYQIFVGEDQGPDNTAQIVREYAEKYPDKIVAFLREENMGAQHNLIDMCEQAKSPYIALCEGDDYWIDEFKLQKQYDYMESNPDMRLCFARAEISAPEDWFLRSYFKENSEGKMIYPECDPLCPRTNEDDITEFRNGNFINMNIAHTSTVFYRYDYNIQIPDWYYDGIVGDHSLILMQLGDGTCAMLPDVVSVYRRSDVGVYMSESMDEHFLKSRLDWVRIMKGMISFYENNGIKAFPRKAMVERIRKEITNYVKASIKINEMERISDLISLYPKECRDIFALYASYYYINRRMIGMYSWEGKQMLTVNKYAMRFFRPFIRMCAFFNKRIRKMRYKVKDAFVYLAKLIGYWAFSAVPKKNNLWVFSGFKKNTFMDNSKYFFEYVNNNYPDIEAVWVTKSDEVYQQVQECGYCAYKMRSWKGIWATARAAIAVVDHFVMSDFSPIYGFNHRTKVVQLWHGVGFKSMGDGEKVFNTTVPGVKYSTDIISQDQDSSLRRFKKKIKYIFKAPVRELFEQYFLFLCPGDWQRDMIGRIWHVSEESFCNAGYPRNYAVYARMNENEQKNQVLYAPTYRFSYDKERELIQSCLDSLDLIQEKMTELDSEFVLRLHPHTWRNYSNMIKNKIQNYDRISLDLEKDFYVSVLNYAVIITDYSSVAIDGTAFNIPAVFFCPDYEWYLSFDAGISIDYMNMTPGPKTRTWQDTMQEVENYLRNPEYRKEENKRIASYYLDEKCNNIENSKVIADWITERLA